jgi:ribose transport system substrate-binding protein
MKKGTLALSLLAAIALAGCFKPKEEQPETGRTGPAPKTTAGQAETVQLPAKPKGANGKWVIGMSQCNEGEPWRVQMDADIKAAAAEHPADIDLLLKDAQNHSEMQQSQVREFVQQKVDLIIISPKEARPLTKPVADAVEAGIPVIVLDRKVEGDKYTCFIGADNVKIGREAGKFLVKLLGGKGDIVELKGLMTSTPGQERHNGFMEGVAGSQIHIIFDADCKWLEPDAQREMKSALAVHPKIDAVYAHNDPSAHGAYMATLQEGKGREKTIKFIGIDALPHEGVRYVRDGLLTATFQYPTGGKEAIETALKILKGEKVQKNTTLGTRIFTKENVDKGGEAL